jgi:hypothetical protein
MNKPSDLQVGGSHYKDMPIEPSYFIQMNKLDWCIGNVVKYTCRHEFKNGVEDIRKAIHYCELLLEWEYSDGEPIWTPFHYIIPPTVFVKENKLPELESYVILSICQHGMFHIEDAIRTLKTILKEKYDE